MEDKDKLMVLSVLAGNVSSCILLHKIEKKTAIAKTTKCLAIVPNSKHVKSFCVLEKTHWVNDCITTVKTCVFHVNEATRVHANLQSFRGGQAISRSKREYSDLVKSVIKCAYGWNLLWPWCNKRWTNYEYHQSPSCDWWQI